MSRFLAVLATCLVLALPAWAQAQDGPSAGPAPTARPVPTDRALPPPGADPIAPPAALPLPESATGPGVLVRAEAGMGSLARDVARRAPQVLARIHEDLWDLPVPATVEIRLIKRSRDMAAASPRDRVPPPWAAGVAYPDHALLVVATRRGPEPIDVPSVVDHELAHLALGAALGERAPRWLHEGFAYLHSSSDWSFERSRTLTGMVWFGNVMALGELEHGFPAHENAAGRAYAQSYDFVAFLAQRGSYADGQDDGDRWAFRRFLTEIAHGSSAERAALLVYDASLDDLFDEWRADLRDRYMLLPVGMFAMGLWVVAALLLIAAYIRRRRQARLTLERWEREERAQQAAWERAVLEARAQDDPAPPTPTTGPSPGAAPSETRPRLVVLPPSPPDYSSEPS